MEAVKKFFGTDGIRGNVGKRPITADFVLKLGWAVGKVLSFDQNAKVLIGKDTRISGYMIESALEAGLSAAGVNCYLVGPIPTSAIAYLTTTLQMNIGIVISASHNPYDDNGIKFFSSEGYKVSEKFELEVEDWLRLPMDTANSAALGKAWRIDDGRGRYIEFCKSSVSHRANFHDLKIVIDCANGATYNIAPDVFRELGAQVIEIFTSPNGLNINENCGSMHPEVIQRVVLQEKADVGIAFDGDGDRVVMVDHTGEVLDGDELLYIILKGLLELNNFTGGIVITEMCNKGFEFSLNTLNIPFTRVPVGDQHVIEGLLQKNWILGGEPSGHVINLNVTTTADGIITALQVLKAMHVCEQNLHELKKGITKLPRCTINIPHNGNKFILERPEVINLVEVSEMKLGKYGRIFMRYSGTEPFIRLLVEGEDQILVDTLAQTVAAQVTHFVNS